MMDNKNAHLCVTKLGIIKPEDKWQVRWITDDDQKAFSEPFRKWQDHGWTLEEFHQLRGEGYSYCGVFLGGRVCSIAGLWKRADDVWEVIAVGTRDEYMRQGMAKSCVYFIADYILQNRKVASYTADESNIPSIRTAQSVGFKHCTNAVNNDKWCAHNPRPSIKDVICPLLNKDS
jgi:RimJ/RimL family protein N-acetyltransferase